MTTREHRPSATTTSNDGGESGKGGDAREQAAKRKVKAAIAHNRAHPEIVAEFDELTGGVAARGVRAIIAWQKANGIPGDGKVGERSIARAKGSADSKASDSDGGEHRAKSGPNKATHVDFSDDEADQVTAGDFFEGEGVADDGDKLQNPTPLAEQAAEHNTPGAERHSEAQKTREAAEGNEAVEHSGTAEIVKTGAEELLGEAGEHGVGGAAIRGVSFLPLVPRLCDLLREKNYGEAFKLVVDSCSGWEQRMEFFNAAAKAAGVGPAAAKWFERAVHAGTAADVFWLEWEWMKLGFESIRAAHEKGDRDSRLGIYAFAWSETVLKGHHANPGAVTEEQKEAMELGIRDGEATRAKNPDLPGLLLARYGDERNARHALQDAVFSDGGIEITTHAEPRKESAK